ncbi:MAG TPA: alpha/beta fold hydrolase [Solirubrobacteraceae bacterium]|nr:alpha/beta fold hydrolase [Solirubrobacteraceae bacterium]
MAVLALIAAPARAAGPAPALRVGSQTLKLCGSEPTAYCGSLPVPLDYALAGSPQISIAYRWYPATAPGAGADARTVVPVEGGPGYPSIESVAYRSAGGEAGYAAMYGPLLARWNMLAIDNRGTGESSPLRCKGLQDFSGPTGGDAFRAAAASCAASLDHRWKRPGGGYLHASDLFSSAPAARDMAAVIEALGLAQVDVYGDSYGSFFAQVFAARFPRLVRSVVLDSTYESFGLDPWYRSTIGSMPGDFDAACERWAACAQAAPGPSWSRIGALAERLRAAPVAGRVPGPGGKLVQARMDVVGLVDLVSDAAEDTRIYRELDAAARALLGAHEDPAPLLRLYAQREYEDEGYFGSPVRYYSVGLYVADACVDYPQLFDMRAPPSQRANELSVAQATLPAQTFAPFSTAEWISQNENTEAFSVCIGWPSPDADAQAPTDGQAPLLPASMPVLVLGGELDSWTPPVDAPKVLGEVGGHARFVELANSTHVVGEGATECGSSLIERFVQSPRQLDSLDVSCAPAVAPVHAVGVYAATLAEEAPLQPSPGNAASRQALQLGAAAVQTAGDAVTRWSAIEAKHDQGLHGGSVTASHGGALLTLKRDRLVPGVAVSGTVELRHNPVAGAGETAVARLTVHAAGLPKASLDAIWTTAGAGAVAQVTGSVGGQALGGTMPAP